MGKYLIKESCDARVSEIIQYSSWSDKTWELLSVACVPWEIFIYLSYVFIFLFSGNCLNGRKCHSLEAVIYWLSATCNFWCAFSLYLETWEFSIPQTSSYISFFFPKTQDLPMYPQACNSPASASSVLGFQAWNIHPIPTPTWIVLIDFCFHRSCFQRTQLMSTCPLHIIVYGSS